MDVRRVLGTSKADKAKERQQRREGREELGNTRGKQHWYAGRVDYEKEGKLGEEEENGDKYLPLLLSDDVSGSKSCFGGKRGKDKE